MPPDLDALRRAFATHSYLFTAHASDRAVERGIASREIEEAIVTGEVIEDYPADKYGPSCLIMGLTEAGRVLHVQASYPPSVKVITVYEPSLSEWEGDFVTRKTR
jgi:hypothetical protein